MKRYKRLLSGPMRIYIAREIYDPGILNAWDVPIN